MKPLRILTSVLGFFFLTVLLVPNLPAADPLVAPASRLRLLVVTGGHDFEREPFVAMFKSFDGMSAQFVEHPRAHALFKPEEAAKYDVLVFYDMWQKISDESKADLVNLLKQGKGMVALHHCLGSYQDWSEYAQIIGGKYLLQKGLVEGVEQPASTYLHDVDFRVQVADPSHPVTRGLTDFQIHDETYGKFWVSSQVQVLLKTDHATSGLVIGWAKTYEAARVVYLELGHDHQAYENPNYRRLVTQSIRWVAKKD